jgi:hypothetical protein
MFLMVSNRKMILLSLETGTRTFCELFALVTMAKKRKGVNNELEIDGNEL